MRDGSYTQYFQIENAHYRFVGRPWWILLDISEAESLTRGHLSMPFAVSVLAVARKRQGTDPEQLPLAA